MTDLTATAHHAETRIHAPASTDQGPLPYHRLGLLTPGWWRPLATLALAVLLYAAMVLALVLPAAVAGLVSPPFAAIMERTVSLDMADPWTLAASLAMLALLVPTCRLTVRLLGRRGTLDSVARRFRWALFRSFVLVALPVTAASVGLSLILSPAPIRVTASTLPLLVVALLLVPFQAAGEEYLFRGLLPQVVGGWLRSQWWGVAISVPLFTLGHSYDAPGLVGVGLFGVAASWVTWRSGGLEAAVALHAVNNLSAFGLGALGISDLNATVVTWPDAVLFSAIPVCFVAIYELRRRRALAARDQTPAVAHVAVIE